MRRIISILLIFLAFCHVSTAQTYSFQHIGVEEGLSQSVVTTVVQDDDGVFWIGTMSGVTKYDGSDYKVFMKSEGLAENWVTSALKDQHGNLWFGHWGGGVSIYNAELQEFQDMKMERFSKFRSVTDIIEDANGDIWFSTSGNGVFKYESKENSVVSFSTEEGFLSNMVSSMCLDARKNIWFGTNQGVVVYRRNLNFEDPAAFLVLTTSDGLASNDIRNIDYVGGDKIAVASRNDGLTVISNTSKLDKLSYINLNASNGLNSTQVTCTFGTNGNDLWIGTADKGVIRYDIKDKVIQGLSTRQGLNYFKVNNLFRDREGNFWIGTDLGLNLFRGDEFLIYDENDGLINNVIWSIAEDSKGRLLFGTNQGLSRLSFVKNAKTGHVENIEVQNFTTKNGLSNNIVLSISVTKDDEIWCGTGFGGVSVIGNNGNRTIDSLKGLGSNTVYSIEHDQNGNHWIGTDKGVSKIDASGKITNYTDEDGLGGDNIYKIFEDSKGVLWFASIGGYLSKYENNKFVRFDSSYQFTQKFITSIAEDEEKNIWFGAYGGGIYMYNSREFVNFSEKDGLSSNSPYSIIADSKGHLWIGTSQGIDKMNLKDRTFKNYREKEGFMGIEPNPNSVLRDSEGNVWFGTIMGAVKFDLTEETVNTIEPITIVQGLKVDHEVFAFPEDNEFDHDENHIEFEYIGISLTNPEHVQYKYMLDGFDKTWSPVTNENDVIYSNIPPGSYVFKVIASNNDDIWNELPTTYSFVINPPFWQTWWFYTLCFILVVSGLYVGDRIRTRKLIEAKHQLELKVEERTQEIAAKNAELQKKNKDILDSINYARRIQTALLPTPGEVQKELKNSFVFFKPKDIVSGDFYWMERVGDKVLFAAADCTGHGVPGAFMSIIGHNGLNKAVIENGITKPSEILDQLNIAVSDTLKQRENEDVKDGMDIAFCSLDLKSNKLEYAGAFNPLYLVRNGEVHETKADRQPIGSFVGEEKKKFTNHSIQLEKGDAIYVFSDGYPDQFGGPKGKKFRYNRFRELLVETHDTRHDKVPEYLDNTINEWRGEIEQIDDIVVIGVKMI